MRDYEKLTLDRLAYLESKIKNLEANKLESFTETAFEFDDCTDLQVEGSCLFDVLNQSNVKITIKGNVNKNAVLCAYIDNVLLAKVKLDSGNFVFNREIVLNKGDKNLKIVINANTSVAVSNLEIVLCGYIAKKKIDYCLSVANFNNYSIVALANEQKVEVFRYDGTLTKKLQDEAQQGYISKSGDSAILCIVRERTFFARKLDYYGEFVGEYVTIDNGITKIAGSNGNAVFCVYAIKGGVVFRYDIAHDLTFSKVNLGFRADKIASSPDVYHSCIITDFNGNSKLIVQE